MLNRFLLPLWLLMVGCGEVPQTNVHPEGTDLSKHEMFAWIVGRCLESDVDLYAISSPYFDANSELGGDMKSLKIDGFLTRPNHNGGPETPEEFEAGMQISERRTLVAHYPPGLRFEVDSVIKVDNPLDAPTYYFVTTLPVTDSESIRLEIRPLLSSGAFPLGKQTPKERIAEGEAPLHESIHFCDDDPS